MKKKLSVVLLFLFLLYLSDIQLIAFQNEGKKLLFEGKERFNKGKFKESIEILNKALNFGLADKEKIEAHLYIGVCWIALNAVNEGENHFKEIIKINPEFIFEEEDFPPEIKNIFDKTKYKFPIIYEFSSLPEIFYPYANDVPYLRFKITAPDCVNLSITSINKSIFEDRECFENSVFQIYKWKWRDELINMNKMNITLIPDRNKNEYSFKKKINLNIEMPKKLFFKNNIFQIEGKKFFPESEIKRSYPNLLLWSGISLLSGFGAYYFFTTEPENNNYYYQEKNKKTQYITAGVISGLLSIFSLIKALTPKKKEISIKKNIDKNNKLKKEIRQLKEKVKVKQKIKG